MARNPLPAALDRLTTLAIDMIDGCTKIGPATGIVQITALNDAGESVPSPVSSITLS